MRGVNSLVVILLLGLVMVSTDAAKLKKDKTGKGKDSKPVSETDCKDWSYGKCVPKKGDCGSGFREGMCNGQVRKLRCKVPCNWKKNFGADCKYKFGKWGECDAATGTMSSTGTLKRAPYNVECQPTLNVSIPCTPKGKSKTKPKAKKGKGREN